MLHATFGERICFRRSLHLRGENTMCLTALMESASQMFFSVGGWSVRRPQGGMAFHVRIATKLLKGYTRPGFRGKYKLLFFTTEK